MKIFYPIVIFIGLSGCQSKVDNLDGHYVSVGKPGDTYETLDIADSLVLINISSVFRGQRDTVVIDTKTNSFLSSTRAMFPIFDFKVVNDTIEVHFEHDAGQDKIKFVKGHTNAADHFSTSYIDVDLLDYDSGKLIDANDLRIVNLTIGPLKKGTDWGTSDKDSICIEYENEFFLQRNELQKLSDKLILDIDDKVILCLNFDKRVSRQVTTEIKNALEKIAGNVIVTESRSRGNEIVYVK
jgi:hypothetical protein